ncbi:MAG: hypothetical protein B7Z55_19980 [Planctomycetales bacterium 12-60-4]|nr:MAG: hypothetical protein B7Z55_19980 [Planctomycetales bacterium 12-60-4]
MQNANRCQQIHAIAAWDTAVDEAWRSISPGDLLVVQSSSIAATVKKLQRLAGVDLSMPVPAGYPSAAVAAEMAT